MSPRRRTLAASGGEGSALAPAAACWEKTLLSLSPLQCTRTQAVVGAPRAPNAPASRPTNSRRKDAEKIAPIPRPIGNALELRLNRKRTDAWVAAFQALYIYIAKTHLNKCHEHSLTVLSRSVVVIVRHASHTLTRFLVLIPIYKLIIFICNVCVKVEVDPTGAGGSEQRPNQQRSLCRRIFVSLLSRTPERSLEDILKTYTRILVFDVWCNTIFTRNRNMEYLCRRAVALD